MVYECRWLRVMDEYKVGLLEFIFQHFGVGAIRLFVDFPHRF